MKTPRKTNKITSSKGALYVSYIGLALYLLLAGIFFLAKDKEHCLMFLCGSIMWIVSAFIHGKNSNDEK